MRWLRSKDRQTPAPASTVALQSAREFNVRGNDEIEIYEGVFDPPQSNTGRSNVPRFSPSPHPHRFS